MVYDQVDIDVIVSMTPLHDSSAQRHKIGHMCMSTILFLAMTSPLQEYSRQLANYTRRQWNTTSRGLERDRVGEDNTSVAHNGAAEKRPESRATTASALQDFDNTRDNRCE